MRSAPNLSLYARSSTPLPLVYELGAGGPDPVRIVCCFLGCDERPYNPLLSGLPPVIHIAASEAPSTIAWLGTLLGVATSESRATRPGSGNVLERLSELVFVEMIRQHLSTLGPAHTGWLAGLRDPVVGQALGALHGEPRESWTVERLARRVGLSRSMFSERFTTMVGDSPMRYLVRWRMQLASHHLLAGDSVAVVAEAVGYQSEAAFSRAFKKSVGDSPATWRASQSRRLNSDRGKPDW
jgi:AraC-like DNA-binding protein